MNRIILCIIVLVSPFVYADTIDFQRLENAEVSRNYYSSKNSPSDSSNCLFTNSYTGDEFTLDFSAHNRDTRRHFFCVQVSRQNQRYMRLKQNNFRYNDVYYPTRLIVVDLVEKKIFYHYDLIDSADDQYGGYEESGSLLTDAGDLIYHSYRSVIIDFEDVRQYILKRYSSRTNTVTDFTDYSGNFPYFSTAIQMSISPEIPVKLMISKPGSRDIWTVDLDSGEYDRIFSPGHDQVEMAISNNHQTILVHDSSGDAREVLVQIDGEITNSIRQDVDSWVYENYDPQTDQLPYGGFLLEQAVISNDGKMVAFVSSEYIAGANVSKDVVEEQNSEENKLIYYYHTVQKRGGLISKFDVGNSVQLFNDSGKIRSISMSDDSVNQYHVEFETNDLVFNGNPESSRSEHLEPHGVYRATVTVSGDSTNLDGSQNPDGQDDSGAVDDSVISPDTGDAPVTNPIVSGGGSFTMFAPLLLLFFYFWWPSGIQCACAATGKVENSETLLKRRFCPFL